MLIDSVMSFVGKKPVVRFMKCKKQEMIVSFLPNMLTLMARKKKMNLIKCNPPKTV